MENIFTIAADCIHNPNIAYKLNQTEYAKTLLDQNQLTYNSFEAVLPIKHVRFPDQPCLLKPREMPKRKLKSIAGKQAFFHSLAHIEFVAIYLAWDIIYRFRGLPDQFYRDWLKVANEEALHFRLITQHLSEIDTKYGDFPAHRGLWDHAEDTSGDVLARLAIVPRCMEARGLDITPIMIEKFQSLNDDKSVQLLSRILQDEIGHVEIGSFWFKTICKERGLNNEETYKELITKHYIGKPKGPFNRELRIIAGFSDTEINWLEEGT